MKVRIEVEDGEYCLLDLAVYINDALEFSDHGFTSEANAVNAGVLWVQNQSSVRRLKE